MKQTEKNQGRVIKKLSAVTFVQFPFAITIVSAILIGIVLILPTGISHARALEKVQPANPGTLPSIALKTIIVANYYPYTFVNDKGIPDGFSLDIAKAVSDVMGRKLETTVDTWENATKALADGSIDLLPMMAASPVRDKLFDFSAPHTIAYDAVFSRDGAQRIRSLNDLAGKTIIVMNKDAAHDYLLSSGMAAKMKLVLVDSLPDALRTLAAGTADAALMPKLVGMITIKRLNLTNLDPSPFVIEAYNRPFCFAVKDGDKALLERLSQGLSIIKSTGQYQEIYNKWFGAIESQGVAWETIIKYIVVIVAVFLLITLGFIFWTVSLRKQVALRTKNLADEIEGRKRLAEIQSFLAKTSSTMGDDSFFHVLARYLAQCLGMDFVCIDWLEGDGLNARTLAVWCDGHFEDNVTYALKDTPCGDVVGKEVCCFPASVCQFFPRDQVLLDLKAESYVGVTLFSHTGQPIGLIAVISRSPLANRALVESILKIVAVRAAGEMERLDAETSLRESEARFHQMFLMHDAIMLLIDPKTGIIRDANKSAELFYGYSKEQFSQMTIQEINTLSAEEVSLQRNLALENKRNYFIFPHRLASGEVKTVEVHSSPITMRDEKMLFSIIHDITDRKQAEEDRKELERKNRQLQKSESLGRMAGAIAHHFNNQLGVVIGNLEMAIDEQPKGALPSESLTSAMQAAWRSADMSGLMLTYLGQSYDKVEPLDISYSCRKILPILKAAIPANVVLEADFSSPGPVINTNTDYMQQILTNLITNAWEAIGKNSGTISLSVKTVPSANIKAEHRPLDWQPQDTVYACLEVTDTGCGIAAKDIEQLFDPFYSTKFTGRGMGLPVILGIAKVHNGVITVESKPASGSTFRVYFPLSEEALSQPQTAKTNDDSLINKVSPKKFEEGGTVLLIEDEEPLRKMIVIMLGRLGFTVLEAKDGIEALEVFGKHQSEIKLVLTDLTMPRMDGWDTLTALRKLQPDIPVILASGYDLAHVMAGDHPELPQAFLAKPYNLTALSNAVRQAIESKGKAEG